MESIVAASNAVIGNEISVITDIHSATKNIAVYQRQIDHLEAELATLINQDISFKASGEIAQIQDSLANYFDTNLPSCPLLIQDISFLLEAYQQLGYVFLVCQAPDRAIQAFDKAIEDAAGDRFDDPFGDPFEEGFDGLAPLGDEDLPASDGVDDAVFGASYRGNS